MSKYKNVFNIFLLIFVVIELIFVVKFKVVVGSGLSMYPTIGDHQVLLCQYKGSYKVDDVVLYKVNGIPIVHRIVKITEYTLADGSTVKTYSMKGDNNDNIDMFETYEENIVCKVVGV